MSQNKHKSGFRKGFLLSSSSSKKSTKKKAPPPKPKQQTSSALLDVGEQDQSPLLFVKESNVSESEVPPEAATEIKPLHVLIRKDDECDMHNDSLGLMAVSTRRKSPLIQEVSPDIPWMREECNSVSSSQAKDDKPPRWEVPPSETMATTSEYPPSLRLETPLEPKEEPVLQAQANVYSKQTNNSTAVPCQLVHGLPNLLWRMKQQRSDDEQATVQQFVSEFIQSDTDWIMAWTFLLNLIVKESAGTTDASVRLGITLIQQDSGMKSFLAFLEPNVEKKAKVLALGGTMLIHSYCKAMREAKQSLKNMAWLAHVLPRLSKIVLNDPTKRSVLSHQCVTAAYDIVAISTSQENGFAHLDLEPTLWDALSIIVELLQIQHAWIEKSLQRENDPSISGDVSRKQCTLSVIDDWKSMLKEALRLEEGLRMESKDEGHILRDERTRLTEYTCLQLGGETLNNVTEKGGLGSLHQTLSNEPPKYTAQQIVSFMEDGTRLLQTTIREKKASEEVQSWQIERVRSILRGLSAWLGQSKKHLQSMTKTTCCSSHGGPDKTCLERAVDLSIQLLRVETDECANLVLVILGNLWSSSNGLPPDFTNVNENDSSLKPVPVSFELLLDELKVDSSDASDALDPTARAFCSLVARCIRSRGASLVTELVIRNGKRSSTVEVLANILSEAQCTSDSHGLLVAAGNIFLDFLESNRYAQRKLVSAPETLRALPVNFVVPRLISLASSNIDDIDLVQAVSSVLKITMVSSLSNDVDEVVQEIINSVGFCQSPQDDTTPNKTLSNKLCRKITSGWRRTLLDDPTCGMNGLASVLSAIANAMFADPSSSIPLELLGSVVGDELVLIGPKESKEIKVYFAVMTVVKQCLNSLENTEIDAQQNKSIYSRLSPLLLLRRIPSGYYKVAWSVNLDDQDEREAAFSQLVNQLSDRLDIPSLQSRPKHVTFTAEERQLAAEIAGRCIPFYNQAFPSCSCYQRICFPSFNSTLCTLQIVSGGQKSIAPKDSLRAARVALYACCTHMPLAEDNEAGEGILGTVSFVLEILNVDVTDVIEHNVIEDELIRLQTGCIEFIAACLESTLQRHVKNEESKLKPAVVVVESNSSSLHVTTKRDSSVSTKDALATSCTAIASCLRAGLPVPHKLRLRNNCFLSQGCNEKKQVLSTSARTCMWNSFLVVSQGCSDDRLASWTNLTAPWVLDWASAAPVDEELHHPLCMAAALQILFILVTRTKSFECFGGGKTSTTSVRKAHRLAVTSIKTETSIGGDYARITMRRAGLKLLLALVTIDQMDNGTDLSGCLSPGELGETFTLLNGTANVDTDAEVRNLAAHILTGMRTS